MDQLAALLDQYASSTNQDEKQRIVNESVEIIKQSNLVSILINVCEKYLVDTVDTKRKVGIQFISDIINNNSISFQIPFIQTIYDFFLVRIEDFPTAEECTEAIYRIMVKYGSEMDCCVKTVQVYSQVGNVCSMKYPSRHNVYKTLNFILDTPAFYPLMKQQGLQYVKWLCSIMVNEKDPRGLLEILTIIKKICILFDSQLDLNMSGELFDIVSNYFPITFTRPPNDIYKITAEDLKQSLNSCFLSSSHLQEFLLPFLLDRIDSGIYNNQKDGLHLLHEHIQKFNLDFVMTDMDDWIEILINQGINGLDDLIQQETFSVLALIIKNIAKNHKDMIFDGFLKPFLELPTKYIYDSPSSLTSHNTVKMLKIILQSSYLCLPQLISVIGCFIENYNHEEGTGLKESYLWCITELLSAFTTEQYNSTTLKPLESQSDSSNPTTSYIDHLLTIYLHCSLNSSVVYYQINGLLHLLHIFSLLSHPEQTQSILTTLIPLLDTVDPNQLIYIAPEFEKFMSIDKSGENQSALVMKLFSLLSKYPEYQYLILPSIKEALQNPFLYTSSFTSFLMKDLKCSSESLDSFASANQLITLFTYSLQKSSNKNSLALYHLSSDHYDHSILHSVLLVAMNYMAAEPSTDSNIVRNIYYYLYALLSSLSVTYPIDSLLQFIQSLNNNTPFFDHLLFHIYVSLYAHHSASLHSPLKAQFDVLLQSIQSDSLSSLFSISILYLFIYTPKEALSDITKSFDCHSISTYYSNPQITFTILVPILQSLYLNADSSLTSILQQLNQHITAVTDSKEQQFYLTVIGKIFSSIPSSICDKKPPIDYITSLATSSFPSLFKFIEEKHIQFDPTKPIPRDSSDMLLLKTVFLFSLFLPREALSPYSKTLLPLLLIDISSETPSEEAFKLIYIVSLLDIYQFSSYLSFCIPLFLKIAQASPQPLHRLISVYLLKGIISLPQNKVNVYIDDVIYQLKPVLNDPQRSVRILAQKTINLWMISKH